MVKEVEINMYLYDELLNNPHMPSKEDVIKILKKMNAKKIGTFLYKVMVFIPPNKNNDYLRVRDEGNRVTLTYKTTNPKNKYQNEEEIIINDFQSGVNILLSLGATKKYYYEKIREIWNYQNSEIVFDHQPALPCLMEIESKSGNESNISIITNAIKVKKNNPRILGKDIYYKIFGITLPKEMDLPYKDMKEILLPLCTKNKDKLIKLINKQDKMLNSIKK
jgi:predicted adenylyl cyclase CyaB